MKKLLLPLTVVCLFLHSCGGGSTNYYSVLITNDSSKTVSYTYNDTSDTLAANTSKTYEVKAYTQPPTKIMDENGIASIDMEQNGDHFTFTDATPIKMNILNTLPVDVKRIKADNYISYNESYLVSVLPGKTIGETTSDELFIYTNKPHFSLEADSDGKIEPLYPIIFDWNITNLDEDELDSFKKPKKKMSVIIR
jgi:hypothetical protein